jgi:hypothetical protein
MDITAIASCSLVGKGFNREMACSGSLVMALNLCACRAYVREILSADLKNEPGKPNESFRALLNTSMICSYLNPCPLGKGKNLAIHTAIQQRRLLTIQLLLQQLIGQLGIRFAACGFHDLTDKKAQQTLFAASVFL